MANGKMLHPYIKEMSREAFQGDCLVTVGETWSADVKDALLYSNPDGSELSMVFQFAHCILDQQPGKEKWDLAPLSLVELKKVFEKWQTGLYQKGWNSLFWDNHDLPRAVSRYGDDGMYRELSSENAGDNPPRYAGHAIYLSGRRTGRQMFSLIFPNTEILRR